MIRRNDVDNRNQEEKTYQSSSHIFLCFENVLKMLAGFMTFQMSGAVCNLLRHWVVSPYTYSLKGINSCFLCWKQNVISSWRKPWELEDCKGCQSLLYDLNFKATILKKSNHNLNIGTYDSFQTFNMKFREIWKCGKIWLKCS